MPAASCPRCWRAWRPSATSAAAESAAPETPKTPHSSRSLSSSNGLVVSIAALGVAGDRHIGADRAFVALCLAIVIGIEPTLPSPVGIAANHRRRTMAKDHGSQIKEDETYADLREDGAAKEKADRNAHARDRRPLDT